MKWSFNGLVVAVCGCQTLVLVSSLDLVEIVEWAIHSHPWNSSQIHNISRIYIHICMNHMILYDSHIEGSSHKVTWKIHEKWSWLRKHQLFEAFFALVVVSNSIFIGIEVARSIEAPRAPRPLAIQAGLSFVSESQNGLVHFCSYFVDECLCH